MMKTIGDRESAYFALYLQKNEVMWVILGLGRILMIDVTMTIDEDSQCLRLS